MSFGPAGLPRSEAEVMRHSLGDFAVWIRPPLLITQATGMLTLGAAQAFDDASRRLVRPGGRYASFHDWENVTDYESEARRLLMAASARNRPLVDRTHILLRSRLLVAALDAARVLLKHIVPYHSRTEFEWELRTAVQAHRLTGT